jgi:hypothetical protein
VSSRRRSASDHSLKGITQAVYPYPHSKAAELPVYRTTSPIRDTENSHGAFSILIPVQRGYVLRPWETPTREPACRNSPLPVISSRCAR